MLKTAFSLIFNHSSLRRIKALVIKEFIQIIYDPSSIILSFFLPVLLLFLYGSGVSLDINHLDIGLALEDRSPDAQSFARAMMDSSYYNVIVKNDRRELVEDLLSNRIRGIVVIPEYFSTFRDRPDTTAPIQVITDGSEPNTAYFVQSYVAQTWNIWLEQEKMTNDLRNLPLVQLQPRFWFNEELESRYFLVPGSMAFIMALIGTLLTALVVAREWERGTMEALMSTPVSITEVLLGKLIPYFCLGMLSMATCVTTAVLIYDIPFRGSILVLVGVTTCFLITTLEMGLLISTITRNQFAASQAAGVAAFLPSYMLSGFIFEIASMPYLIQLVTYLIPARYFVKCLLTLFLVGNVWSLIFWNVCPMLLIAIVLFFAISKITFKHLD